MAKKEKRKAQEYDAGKLAEYRSLAQKMKADAKERNDFYEECEDAFLLNWEKDAPPEGDEVKVTISPDASMAVKGAHRLIKAGEPSISMPYDENDAAAYAASSKMETFARLMWKASGRILGQPVQNDLSLSALLYGRVDLSVTRTQDLMEYASGDGMKRRAKRIARTTPVLFQPWSPKFGYPEWDRLGLVRYLQSYETTAGTIVDEWGDLAEAVLGDVQRTAPVTYNDLYEMAEGERCVWLDGYEIPLLCVDWDHDYWPVICQVTDGSRLFEELEDQAWPFLREFIKSGLWQRQNLSYTALYTAVAAIAMNPLFLHTSPPGSPGKALKLGGPGRLRVGEIIEMDPGEKFEPMFAKGAIDPALVQALELAERKGEETTIYRQSLGEPIGKESTYSTTALLHQAGRLPLVSPTMLTGWAIAAGVETAFRIIKEDSGEAKVRYRGKGATITPADIPEDFEFEVRLEVDLAQERLQMATLGQGLIDGGLASKSFVREKLLNVGQSDAMDEEIWSEQAGQASFEQFVKMMLEMGQAPQVPPGGGGGAEPPPPGAHVMPDGSLMPDSEMPERVPGTTPSGGTPAPPVEPPLPGARQGGGGGHAY